MSLESTQQDPHLICCICKRFEAKTTCYSCNDWICLSCSRISFVKFSHYTGGRDFSYDYEYIKAKRCVRCDGSNVLPKIVQPSSSCVIS